MRSSSKNTGTFIAAEVGCAIRIARRSRFVLFFRLEGLGHQLSVGLLQQNLYAPFGFFQLLLALARKLHALFEQSHGFVQRELRTLEPPHHFFQTRERLLKVRLLRRLRFFYGGRIHVQRSSFQVIIQIVSHAGLFVECGGLTAALRVSDSPLPALMSPASASTYASARRLRPRR